MLTWALLGTLDMMVLGSVAYLVLQLLLLLVMIVMTGPHMQEAAWRPVLGYLLH